MKEIPVIFVMGPTASGKTGLAFKIFDQFPCEIISVDSVMIYRGMDIGSAKPPSNILQKYPHHLINILDPSERYSAADFRNDTAQLIQQINANGKIPLLVGGTMLYFSALQRGLSEMPSANLELRNKIEEQAKTHGWQAMHEQLALVDAKAAEKIHANDPQRIQRALEVYALTGIPISEWQQKNNTPTQPLQILKLALLPEDRTELHRRIVLRFDEMLEQGFVDEVKHLFNRGDLHTQMPAMRAVGYRQIWEYLAGNDDMDTMREKAIAATRQLAKRQLTWLRNEEYLVKIPAERTDDKGLFHDICHKIEAHMV